MSAITFLPASLIALAAATAAQAPAATDSMRFAAMDRNHDGVITREEWQGSERSFRVHDWNGDGVLSGDELEPGAERHSAWPGRFDQWDVNHDGMLSRNEWQSSADRFDRHDRNHDGVISREELAPSGAQAPSQTGAYRAGYDRGLVEGREAGREDKTRNHWDLDGQRELETADSGYVPSVGARPEYQAGYRDGFRKAYTDGFNGVGGAEQSQTYRAGYARGLTDGREAGREDKTRNHWDLDGQRELEQADAGYTPNAGPRGEYQAGYRAGFKKGYADGFGPR